MNPTNETLNSTGPNLSSDKVFLEKKLGFLEGEIERLNQLCETIDPYSELSEEQVLELGAIGINEVKDPFHVTNQLVVKLEDAIQEFQEIKKHLKL
ncbi:MAG: hypothetical protein ACPGJV_03955 [Bacteriovoracaceae bacterium]